MKKIMLAWLGVLLVLQYALCACGPLAPANPTNDDLANNQEEPPANKTYHYDTYEELLLAFTAGSQNPLKVDAVGQSAAFNQMITTISAAKEIPVPQLEQQNMQLQDKIGFSNISLFQNELYGLPWIWYHGSYDNSSVVVKIAYLSCVEGLDPESIREKSCADVIKSISPNAVNTDNFRNFSSYKNVYETTLNLAEKDVTAVVYELVDGSEISVSLIYDDVFVRVSSDASVLTDAFWDRFSLGRVKKEENTNALSVASSSGDRPSLTLDTKRKYRDYIKNNDLPDHFITYEQLSCFGKFASLVFLEDVSNIAHERYEYVFTNKGDQRIFLKFYYQEEKSNDLEQITPEQINDDMRTLSSDASGVYRTDGVEYKYTRGKLRVISWSYGEYTVTLSGNPRLCEYSSNNKLVNKFLTKGETAEAIELFRQSVQGEGSASTLETVAMYVGIFAGAICIGGVVGWTAVLLSRKASAGRAKSPKN